MYVNGSVAYVPQTAWILNRTVKENILFYRDYDPDRYREGTRGPLPHCLGVEGVSITAQV